MVIMNMKMEEIFHMIGGAGQDSYANNSVFQNAILIKTKPVLEECVDALFNDSMVPLKCMKIADLGCASGQNALMPSVEIIGKTYAACKNANISIPEFQIYLNDLPGNDFNSLFSMELPKFHKWLKELEKGNNNYPRRSCYISATPGSFYGRLFPDNSLHLVHAASCLHFLSQIPKELVDGNGVALNKGAISITKRSPPQVHKAYCKQFSDGFTLFLQSRAKEIVPGGRMVLAFRTCTKSDEPDYQWDLQSLGMALKSMAIEGLISEEKLDKFNVPFYSPAVKEVRELISAEGSFIIHKIETVVTDWADPMNLNTKTKDEKAKFVEYSFRAAAGPTVAADFGQDIIDELFHRFKDIIAELLSTIGKLDTLYSIISLEKKE